MMFRAEVQDRSTVIVLNERGDPICVVSIDPSPEFARELDRWFSDLPERIAAIVNDDRAGNSSAI